MTLAGTLSVSQAVAQEWDVVVIGAGVGGSLAARELARAGSRVLLIDKKSFPRRKVCGACLNGAALRVLANAGLSERIAQLGGIPLTGFAVQYGGRRLKLPLPAGMSISREILDTALIQSAIAEGVEFLPETSAAVTDDHSTAMKVAGWPGLERTHDAPERGVRTLVQTAKLTTDACRSISLSQHQTKGVALARVIIVASGLGAPGLPATREWKTESDDRSRIGIGCVVDDVAKEFDRGTIWMGVGPSGYVGLVRLENGRLNVAAAVDRQILAECGTPGLAAKKILSEAGFSSPQTLLDAEWQGTVSLTRSTHPVASRQVFVIGDAAGYVEPFTGEGMAWAMSSGIAVAPWARRAIEGWSEQIEHGWAREHRRLIQRQQRKCRLVSRLLRSPNLLAVTVSLLKRWPWLARIAMNGT